MAASKKTPPKKPSDAARKPAAKSGAKEAKPADKDKKGAATPAKAVKKVAPPSDDDDELGADALEDDIPDLGDEEFGEALEAEGEEADEEADEPEGDDEDEDEEGGAKAKKKPAPPAKGPGKPGAAPGKPGAPMQARPGAAGKPGTPAIEAPVMVPARRLTPEAKAALNALVAKGVPLADALKQVAKWETFVAPVKEVPPMAERMRPMGGGRTRGSGNSADEPTGRRGGEDEEFGGGPNPAEESGGTAEIEDLAD